MEYSKRFLEGIWEKQLTFFIQHHVSYNFYSASRSLSAIAKKKEYKLMDSVEQA